ncbi:pentatricopeptide repeat-containing protein At1g71060, mitochondrial [Cucumis melo]|uniref:Pentatricopeptide repeat-containing protein At1g71060, mitochondrial n=1 Tax=Cucumis melo TaxID=3656 RepID=A0A1S3CT11_CUCME|nr:pentatricopeptide repeat-containing protein At1g71060, mitochondrial [Cucumis melo]XP_050945669.1 pentatricopeptide repeat-containing protein At1g71060, mitochondrial [Cucumis melo]XP_050945670.1 pentatricopeptide repeat-containing protein At1g71060, mitochondrial [Cucumis melo]
MGFRRSLSSLQRLFPRTSSFQYASARSFSCSKTITRNQTSICISSRCNEHSTWPILNRDYTSQHSTHHGNEHSKQDLEAGQKSIMESDEITQDAEKFCKLISKNPNSCIESLLDGAALELSPALIEEVLKKLCNAGFLALSFFRWAEKQKGFKHTTESYNCLIEALGKIKQFNVIWNLVSDMKRKGILSRETFALITRRYARARKVKEAIESYEKMEKFGFQLGVSDFNRLIDTLCKSRNVKKAQEVFDKMKHGRFKPDIKSYTILLEGWGQDQNLLKLNEVYREMRDNGFEPDVVTFGILINAHCKARKYDEAIRLFHDMKAKNIKPSPHVFCTLINGLGSEKRLKEALEFFEQLKLSGFAPEAPTYNAVVGAYCWSMKMADAYRMVDDMRKSGIGPNSRTYDIILHHLIKGRKSKEAYSVFQRMSREPGCEPTLSTYEIMIRMFCNEERVDMAIQIWDEMKAKGVLPGMHLFSMLINRLCHENKLEDACTYFQEMLDVGIRPPATMFSNLKQALLDDGRKDTALLLAEKIKKLRKTPLVG